MCVFFSAAEELDQLTALAFRHAANRLRGRDPAAAEEASGPRRTDLWHCEQEILNLGRLRVGGRLGENIGDPHSPRGEFLLQGRPTAADLVRLPQGPQPLIERLRRSSPAPLARHRGILGNPRLAEHLIAPCPSTSCLPRRRRWIRDPRRQGAGIRQGQLVVFPPEGDSRVASSLTSGVTVCSRRSLASLELVCGGLARVHAGQVGATPS